jgi:hypothetical protein
MSVRKPDEGRYSRISRRVWVSKDFRALSAPKPNARTLWLRLLCGPELGVIPGLFEMRESGMAEALEWPLATFRRCLKEITDRGMATFDKSVGLMWVPKAIHHSPPDNPNGVIGWKVAWKDLPECHVKDQANVYLQRWCVERGEGWVTAWEKVAGNVPPNVTPPEDPTCGKPDSDSDSDSHSEGAVVVPKPDVPDPDARVPCPVPLPLDAQDLDALELDVAIPRAVAEANLRAWAANERASKSSARTVSAWVKCGLMALRRKWSDGSKRAEMRALATPTQEPEAPKPERVRTYLDVQREEAERDATRAARRPAAP